MGNWGEIKGKMMRIWWDNEGKKKGKSGEKTSIIPSVACTNYSKLTQ